MTQPLTLPEAQAQQALNALHWIQRKMAPIELPPYEETYAGKMARTALQDIVNAVRPGGRASEVFEAAQKPPAEAK